MISLVYTAINAGLAVLIWLVQIIIYPGMHGWDQDRFADLHKDYAKRMSFIVGPLMLGQAALALYQLVTVPGTIAVMHILLLGIIWVVTMFISVPLHRKLDTGYDKSNVHRLVTTNWLRTVCWNLIFLIDMVRWLTV